MTNAYEHERAIARALALQAGEAVMDVYRTDFEVVLKDKGQGPVTLADQRANEIIVEGLMKAFPGDGVIAEESDAAHNASTSRRGRCWFVDPVDGTQEFVEKNGMFAVQIGLAEAGVARVGVVYAPATGKLYSGAVGDGATLQTAGGAVRAIRVAEAPDDPSLLRVCVSRSHKSKKTEGIRAALGITRVIEHGSVGLKAGLIAEGAADLYLHPGDRSYRWDSCGPEAILVAAGGLMLDFAGAPYRYDTEELRNARGMVGASPKVWAQVEALVKQAASAGGPTGTR